MDMYVAYVCKTVRIKVTRVKPLQILVFRGQKWAKPLVHSVIYLFFHAHSIQISFFSVLLFPAPGVITDRRYFYVFWYSLKLLQIIPNWKCKLIQKATVYFGLALTWNRVFLLKCVVDHALCVHPLSWFCFFFCFLLYWIKATVL